MVKLNAPLMSLNARGRLSKLFSLARRQGQNIIERRPRPTDAKSPAQLFNRNMFSMCKDLWHLLSEAEKAEWERQATPRHMTGYAWYISQCLRPNPGIYLPLIGGTMQGDIDMDSNRILALLDPTVNQEAATKKYVDDLAPGLHANTHETGGADEIDVVGLLGLLANDQHIIDAEAVSAMGAKGDANPLHHDRYLDAEAAAIAAALIVIHAALPNVHHTPPAAGATLTIAETEVFNGNTPSPAAWTDLDLSGVVGTNVALVILKFSGSLFYGAAVRKNGDTDDNYTSSTYESVAHLNSSNRFPIVIVPTDDGGIIEWKAYDTNVACIIEITVYFK